MTNALGIRFAFDAFQETFVIQEKFAAQNLVAVKLFKQVTGGEGHLTERLFRIFCSPADKNGLRFSEALLVHQGEALLQFGDGGERRANFGRLRGNQCRKEKCRKEKKKNADGF